MPPEERQLSSSAAEGASAEFGDGVRLISPKHAVVNDLRKLAEYPDSYRADVVGDPAVARVGML